MSLIRGRRLLPALLILLAILCGVAMLVSLAQALDERRAADAATEFRLAVLLVAQVSDADTLNAEENALFRDAVELLDSDPELALSPLPPTLQTEALEEIASLNEHAHQLAMTSMSAHSGHSVASHHRLQDLLRMSAASAAADATTSERRTAFFSVGLFASLTALIAALVRSRFRSDLYRSAADRFGTLLDQSPDATAVIGEGGAVTYASAAMHRLLGDVPHTRSDLLQLASDQYRPELGRHLDLGSEGDTSLCIGSRLEVPTGAADREFDVRVLDLSDDPLVGGRLVTIIETTSENRARRQLEHLAGHDQLTGLANRRTMMADLVTDPPSALLMVDLDGFKKTNDTLGHGAGDELLIAISRRFEAALPEDATLYRLGGDEFAVLLNTTFDVARRTAADLLGSLTEPVELSVAYERASASIGVAHRDAGDGSISLLRRADIALYDAKRRGGGQLRALDADLEHRSVHTSELTRAFQTASFKDEFRLVYQPIVDSTTGRTKLVEALARWTSPAHGVVRPDEFIPLAESSGRIVELGDWVLDQALADLSRWRRAGLSSDVGVSINVSPFQLTSGAFPLRVAERLAHYSIEPSSITVELTESAVVADDDGIIARLNQLRGLGCSVACDDFGSGYSNLGQLMKLPLNLIKIDRKLLTTLDRMREQAGSPDQPCQVMSAMVSIGEAMQAEIVAEGVETVEQVHSLRRARVQLLQGYLFSRPVEVDELLTLIEEPAPV